MILFCCEIWGLLRFPTPQNGDSVPTFLDNLAIPSSTVKRSEKNEDGTNSLPRNVGMEMPFYAAGNSRRAQDIYLVAEAWNTRSVLFIGITLKFHHRQYKICSHLTDLWATLHGVWDSQLFRKYRLLVQHCLNETTLKTTDGKSTCTPFRMNRMKVSPIHIFNKARILSLKWHTVQYRTHLTTMNDLHWWYLFK